MSQDIGPEPWHSLYTLDGHRAVPQADVTTWSQWFETTRIERIVAQTHLWPEIMVSTVFLGMNHGWGRNPQLFETMVFSANWPLDAQWRYATWEEAEAGHQAVVAEFGRWHVRARLLLWRGVGWLRLHWHKLVSRCRGAQRERGSSQGSAE